MTLRTYYHSDETAIQSQVLSCSPDSDGLFRVILTETLFHPQGGGQPSDQGTIAGVNVGRVFQDGDDLIHIVEAPVLVGDVHIEIASELRNLHARLHSAGHLIANVIELQGWQGIKGHHWPGEARVVFERSENAVELDAAVIEHMVNQLTIEDHPRHIQQVEGSRIVGFGPLATYSCGGTHVNSTGKVGRVKISKIKEKKGQLSIQYEVLA
ncbi:MAG: alanyl-tRNA editing protein [Pseudomonas sp.]|nr:alanyl-tRNA editing protein [Pseudomonas sp.]